MYQEPEEQRSASSCQKLLSCFGLVLRLCCCMSTEDDLSLADGTRTNLLESRDRRLVSHQESAIEATLSPPRTALLEHRSPLKGVPPGASHPLQQLQQRPSGGGQPRSTLPPTHNRSGSNGSGLGTGASTPTKGGELKGKTQSMLSLLDDDDMCPTCLEPYCEDNPKVVTKCGHHFHLPCIYEWMERSETCPMCGRQMKFEEVL